MIAALVTFAMISQAPIPNEEPYATLQNISKKEMCDLIAGSFITEDWYFWKEIKGQGRPGKPFPDSYDVLFLSLRDPDRNADGYTGTGWLFRHKGPHYGVNGEGYQRVKNAYPVRYEFQRGASGDDSLYLTLRLLKQYTRQERSDREPRWLEDEWYQNSRQCIELKIPLVCYQKKVVTSVSEAYSIDKQFKKRSSSGSIVRTGERLTFVLDQYNSQKAVEFKEMFSWHNYPPGFTHKHRESNDK